MTKSTKKDTKTRFLQIRMEPELEDRIKKSAGKKGLKPSQLLRMWAIEKLDEEDKEKN